MNTLDLSIPLFIGAHLRSSENIVSTKIRVTLEDRNARTAARAPSSCPRPGGRLLSVPARSATRPRSARSPSPTTRARTHPVATGAPAASRPCRTTHAPVRSDGKVSLISSDLERNHRFFKCFLL